MLILLVFLFSSCGPIQTMFEPAPPYRNFKLSDLLIEQEIVSPEWQSFPPLFPAGDDLATEESIEERYGIVEDKTNTFLATQDVYRYETVGVARRVFDNRFISRNTRALTPTSEWKYTSPIAYQTRFGCIKYPWDLYCVWAGNYEEYIVLFDTKMIPGQMSFNDIERIVKAIDAKMAFYLKIP